MTGDEKISEAVEEPSKDPSSLPAVDAEHTDKPVPTDHTSQNPNPLAGKPPSTLLSSIRSAYTKYRR